MKSAIYAELILLAVLAVSVFYHVFFDHALSIDYHCVPPQALNLDMPPVPPPHVRDMAPPGGYVDHGVPVNTPKVGSPTHR